MSKSRAEVVSFSTKLDYGTMGIFIKNPDNVYNYFAYLEPLSYWSWVSVTLFLFMFSIILFTMARLVKEPFTMSIVESLETIILAFLLKTQGLRFESRLLFYCSLWLVVTKSQLQ